MEEKTRVLFLKIDSNISVMEDGIEEIRKKHNKILSTPFYEEDDFHDLDRLMSEVQSVSSQTWTLLKAGKQARQKESYKQSSIRMENVQISSLTQKFLDVLADYSAAQAYYRERKKKLLQKQLHITGQQVDDAQLEKMLDENRAIFTQDYIVEVERAREELLDVRERYSELLKIESSLREVDDMLLSLSILVNGQGEIIDSVEQHVLEASEDVREGTKDIEKASGRALSNRKKWIILIICLLLLIAVLVTVGVMFSS